MGEAGLDDEGQVYPGPHYRMPPRDRAYYTELRNIAQPYVATLCQILTYDLGTLFGKGKLRSLRQAYNLDGNATGILRSIYLGWYKEEVLDDLVKVLEDNKPETITLKNRVLGHIAAERERRTRIISNIKKPVDELLQ